MLWISVPAKTPAASLTSIGSMMVRMLGDMAIISPLFRQSFLFSSMTVFMFSIQTASIGPSKTNHFRSSVWFLPNSLKSTATIPSAHSFDTSSKVPYRHGAGMLLGFSRACDSNESNLQATLIILMPSLFEFVRDPAWCTMQPGCMTPSLARSDKVFCKQLSAVVLPLKGIPTNITL